MRITPATIATSACAVLLALNLMVTTAPASPDIAPATANATGPPVPYIVKLMPLNRNSCIRVCPTASPTSILMAVSTVALRP